MLLSSPEFVENSDYGFAVAKIRALETHLLKQNEYALLIADPWDRFTAQLAEFTGLSIKENDSAVTIGDKLEERFTDTFFLVKQLLIEDEFKRLVSLKYDYELLKFIIKQKNGYQGRIPTRLSMRSNYPYPVLTSLLDAGKVLDTGSYIFTTYEQLLDIHEITGKIIDNKCSYSYYNELFHIINQSPNAYIQSYYIREVDAHNVTTVLRMKRNGEKRLHIKARFLPFGSVAVSHFEDAFDLNIDGFIGRLSFTWFSRLLSGMAKVQTEELQIAIIEELLDEGILEYSRESMFVTFGVEPVISYLWEKERELQNLRTILFMKASGISPDEIKLYVRNINE